MSLAIARVPSGPLIVSRGFSDGVTTGRLESGFAVSFPNHSRSESK